MMEADTECVCEFVGVRSSVDESDGSGDSETELLPLSDVVRV